MAANLAKLIAHAQGRPLLMERGAIEEWGKRIRAADARAFERPGRLGAFMRKIAGVQPVAMDDDGPAPQVPLEQQLVYSPLFIGEAEDTGYCWSLKDGVALLCVDTPLIDEGEVYCGTPFHGYDTLLAALQEASADARVGAIFLKLKTPGGFAAGGIVTLCDWMRKNRAAAGGKPIWVYAAQACSAAYWIGAQADKIVAPDFASVGSIGCYWLHEDWSGAYEQIGLKITPVEMFENKTDGANWKSLSAGAAADAQSEIAYIVKMFTSDVTAGRPQLTYDKQKDMRSRAFFSRNDDTERSGLALGLVDEISSEQDAFAALAALVAKPAASGDLNANAPAARAGTSKEQSMAHQAQKKPGPNAAKIEQLRASASAQSIKADQLAAADAAADTSAEDDNDDAPAPEEKNDEPEATKIAKSAEAKTHPALAMAAISSGQTYDQFKASVDASGNAPRGALAEALKDAPRMGADTSVKPGAVVIDHHAIYAARRPASSRR